jgi:hypothetical protein
VCSMVVQQRRNAGFVVWSNGLKMRNSNSGVTWWWYGDGSVLVCGGLSI